MKAESIPSVSIRVEGNRIFSQQQILEAMLTQVGDVFLVGTGPPQ